MNTAPEIVSYVAQQKRALAAAKQSEVKERKPRIETPSKAEIKQAIKSALNEIRTAADEYAEKVTDGDTDADPCADISFDSAIEAYHVIDYLLKNGFKVSEYGQMEIQVYWS